MDGYSIIPISSINHWEYCARRCGLIYIDGQFAENVHTTRGTAEHARVDTASYETSGYGARLEFALPVWSDRLGLVGKCDVVEFHLGGAIYPVEYKHGPKRRWLNDDLQLVAQGLCLEEMFSRSVPRGAIFHVGSHRRREIDVTAELRILVERAITGIRAMFSAGQLPRSVTCPCAS